MKPTLTRPALSWWRVSTDQQEDFSPEAQRQANEEAAKRAGFKRVVHLGATERSTESVTTGGHRPAFEAMLRRIEAGEFGAVFVTRFDRLASNGIDAQRASIFMQRTATKLYEGGAPQDLRNAANRLVATIKSTTRGDEIEGRTGNTLDTKVREAAKGYPQGTHPFGRHPKEARSGRKASYQLDASGCVVWEADREARDYVRRACRLRLQGMSWLRIVESIGTGPGQSSAKSGEAAAKILRERVTTDPSITGRWERSFNLKGLRRPEDFDKMAFADRVTFSEGKAIVTYPIPALVDEATLAKVRAVGEDRYQLRVRPGKEHALKGVLRCGHCGSAMLTIRNHKHDGVVRVWHPPKSMRPGCPSTFGHYSLIETTVLGALSEMLRDESAVEAAVREALAADAPDTTELRTELASLTKQQRQDAARVEEGLDSFLSAKVASVREALEAKVAKLQEAVQRRQSRIDDLSEKLRRVEIQPEAAATIRATMQKLKGGHALVQSKVEQQQQAIHALIVGEGSLRYQPARPEGVFLMKQKDGTVAWAVRGRFFEATGEATWETSPEVTSRSNDPAALRAALGPLRTHASERAHTRACCAPRRWP